jgi:hypothetical protein
MRKIFGSILVLFLLSWSMCFAQKPTTSTGAVQYVTVNFAAGASTADPVEFNGCTPIRVIMPIGSPGWTPASLTFRIAEDKTGVYRELVDEDGASITLKLVEGAAVQVPSPADLLALQWVTVRSGTIALPVTQTSARSLIFVCQQFSRQ